MTNDALQLGWYRDDSSLSMTEDGSFFIVADEGWNDRLGSSLVSLEVKHEERYCWRG
ncbi:hypothetical protein FHS18_002322 [Paenibacillus phyllosphaerae]|uniref:Uncharacterized protein n=1 Tax=Paenibacillus phyllosphaerae TaxID=274593 RepID=A0A7W5AWU2_9BACL|nr:hypothetical protein [Paenibacillus phyllosphaerae]